MAPLQRRSVCLLISEIWSRSPEVIRGKRRGVKLKVKKKNIFLESSGLFSHWPPALPQQGSDVPDVLVPHINWLIKAVLWRWTMFGLCPVSCMTCISDHVSQFKTSVTLTYLWSEGGRERQRNAKTCDFALLQKKKKKREKHIFPSKST